MTEHATSGTRILEKPTLLKRIGYALIVVALVFLTIITTSTALYAPLVAVYSYALIVGGFALVLVNKILENRYRRRLRDSRVYCVRCGWSGSGTDWYKSESCPECDGEEVVMVEPGRV